MKHRPLVITLVCAAIMLASAVSLTLPAAAEVRHFTVRLADGSVVTLSIDVPPGTPIDQIDLPGVPLLEGGQPIGDGAPVQPVEGAADPAAVPPTEVGSDAAAPVVPPVEEPAEVPSEQTPDADRGDGQAGSGDRRPAKRNHRRRRADKPRDKVEPRKHRPTNRERPAPAPKPVMRQPDGAPAPRNPTYFDALPGPSRATGVPNFVIRKFRVPLFLLPIYQAAGIQYGVRWEVLAAINEIETDYGRNLNVSSAGALGWMQFMPATWKAYGVDANDDGQKDPYNPVDAIFAAARYLDASGAGKDIRGAIFAYNRADWYVDSVLMRARMIAGVPEDVVGSLTGLTEGRFPVYARARYADDLAEDGGTKRVSVGENAANLIEDDESRRGIRIFARKGAPVVAVGDGVVKKMGVSDQLGRYLVLQDVYGNRFTYSNLGSLARLHPVPKGDAAGRDLNMADATSARDPRPTAAASAGRQPDDSSRTDSGAAPGSGKKLRLFAHPQRPRSQRAGGLMQLLDAGVSSDDTGLEPVASLGGWERFRNYFSRPLNFDPETMGLERLRPGARVIGGTILGKLGAPRQGIGSHLYFGIRPAGRGAPLIDPKPILDGWKLLESTAIYRASGRNALYGDGGFSIGQILLLPKPLLERRVLADERIQIYGCGRADIASHQIDRRVLATLAYLSESGLRPTVSSLKCGHGFLTASGNVSHHSSGNAVDISAVNGVPILGNQEKGGITEQTVRRLMSLQGTLAADQIISLLDLGGATLAMGDHADHIHLGFRPMFGSNEKLGQQAQAVLQPGQWSDLLSRLREIDNPVVPHRVSRFAIPAKDASDAPAGD